MNDYSLFLGKFLTHPGATAIASLAPSSRWLSRTTVRNIAWDRRRVVVELGAGTGPITRVLAEQARPECRVIVLERDPDFARLLARAVRAAQLRDRRGGRPRPGRILADRGIGQVDHVDLGPARPLVSHATSSATCSARSGRSSRPEGTFNQITEMPWVYWRFYRKFFDEVGFAFEPRNIPPAGAYFCRGVKDIP